MKLFFYRVEFSFYLFLLFLHFIYLSGLYLTLVNALASGWGHHVVFSGYQFDDLDWSFILLWGYLFIVFSSVLAVAGHGQVALCLPLVPSYGLAPMAIGCQSQGN